MTNKWSKGKSPLKMECPRCGEYNAHRTVETDPGHYGGDDEEAPLFQKISGKDISYRLRKKKCDKCKRAFYTVEMSKTYLDDMVSALLEYDKKIHELERDNKKLSNNAAALNDRLRKIRRLAAAKK